MDVRASDIVKVIGRPLELNCKPGDKILIITDTKMDPILWQSMAEAANAMGVEPAIGLMTPREAHAMDPVSSIRAAALDPETDLVVYLTSTAMAHSRLTDDLIAQRKFFLLMEELTPEMLAPDGPGGADYDAMGVVGSKVAALFTQGKQITVKCPNGTDLTASIEGRPGRSIAGRLFVMQEGGGGGCAFPDGEAHICPVEGTGNGRVVFDTTAHNVGFIKEPLVLVVKDGMVTDIEGGREAQVWRDVLAKHGDPNSYNCPAEIAVGLNPNVVLMGSMRSDKKMYGTSHIGMGDTIALGGTCHANLRLEGVIKEPEISVDGTTITRGGKILV